MQHSILDAKVALGYTYNYDAAFLAYQAYQKTPTETLCWEATKQVIPLASVVLWHEFGLVRDVRTADEYIADVSWKVYRTIKGAIPIFNFSSQYTAYMAKTVKSSLLNTRRFLRKQRIPEDWKPRRPTEGSVTAAENSIFLREVIELCMRDVVGNVRFGKKHTEAVRHCLRDILAGVYPNKQKLKNLCRIKDPDFIIQWVFVRTRIALYKIRRNYEHLRLDSPFEHIFDPEFILRQEAKSKG